MEEEIDEVDLDQFVRQPVPKDPEKLRLSLIFSKDLITTLQQDIADLHHRLQIADSEYDGTHTIQDAEDDERAGVHVTNATLTKMDMDMHNIGNIDSDSGTSPKIKIKRNVMFHHPPSNDVTDLYGTGGNDADDLDLYEDEKAADTALNKKRTDHERFFSTYNILSKQVHTEGTLIHSMGSLQALLHLSDNAVTFTDIVANLQMKLKTAKDAFNLVRDTLDGLGVDVNLEDDDMAIASLSDDFDNHSAEKQLFLTSAQQILRESQKIVTAIDGSIDELNGAKHLVHPDQKKIFELQSKVREMDTALPTHKIKKLAILAEMPRFIKEELSDAKIAEQAQMARELANKRGHKKKRTRTLVDDDIRDNINVGDYKFRPEDERDGDGDDDEEYDSEEVEEARIESFDSTMLAMDTAINKLQFQLKHINEHVNSLQIDLEMMAENDNDQAQLLLGTVNEVQQETATCQTAAYDIISYFKEAKEYVHPTQNVLITAINQYIEQKVENDNLQKQIAILKGELETKEEQIVVLKNEKHDMAGDEIEEERNTQEFVNQIINQLQELKNTSLSLHNSLKQRSDDEKQVVGDMKIKTSISYDEIKKMDIELTSLRNTMQSLNDNLMAHEYSVLNLTPTHRYVLSLESRYANLKKLYRLKFSELEQARDAVNYSEELLETKNDEIEELEERLLRIMTSASTAADTRMIAINSMGASSQTYQSVMKLIDDKLRTTTRSLQEIEKLAKAQRSQSVDEHVDYGKEMAAHCKVVKKGLEAVKEEMTGARNFVHADRQMVQSLQEQILEMQRQDTLGLGVMSNASTDQKDEDRLNELAEDEEDDDSRFAASPSSKVQFTSATMTPHTSIRRMGSSSSAYDRRTRSVHEIAWSKFDATKERGMEELQNKEREVLEEEIRRQIMEEVKGKYDDLYDREVAGIRAQLQQSIREEIRAEYEDLNNHLVQNTQHDEEEMERQRTEIQKEYQSQLEAERQTMKEQMEKTMNEHNAQIMNMNEGYAALQSESDKMQREVKSLREREERAGSELESARRETEKVLNSKLRLIEATSKEIDSLRHKIKMYTMGNWGGVISAGDGHRNGF